MNSQTKFSNGAYLFEGEAEEKQTDINGEAQIFKELSYIPPSYDTQYKFTKKSIVLEFGEKVVITDKISAKE